MSYIVGIDGCTGGWIIVAMEVNTHRLTWKTYKSLEFLNGVADVKLIGIDIPIGLPEIGARACDLKSRKLLKKRGSSVFPAPLRAVLDAKDFREACDIRYRIEGKKMSKQAWAIVPKIREVDSLVRESLRLRTLFYEVHPEVSFFFMGSNEPNRYSKKKSLGIEERIKKLAPYFRIDPDYISALRREHGVLKDDIVDAMAALWSAARIFHKENIVLQEDDNAEGPKIYA